MMTGLGIKEKIMNSKVDFEVKGVLTVYSKPNCPFCVKIKEFLKEKGIFFIEVDVSSSKVHRDYIISKGLKTVPQLFEGDGAYHGDCTSFIEKHG